MAKLPAEETGERREGAGKQELEVAELLAVQGPGRPVARRFTQHEHGEEQAVAERTDTISATSLTSIDPTGNWRSVAWWTTP